MGNDSHSKMPAPSEDLVWLLVRNNNSRMVKVPNQRPLSKEHSNVANVHSFKYSGLASSKPVAVKKTGKNSVELTTRKPKSSFHTVKAAVENYRPDLAQASMSRVSRIKN